MKTTTPAALGEMDRRFTSTPIAAVAAVDPRAAYGPSYFPTDRALAVWLARHPDARVFDLDRNTGEWQPRPNALGKEG